MESVTLMAEVAITGEKAGWQSADYAALAHDQALMERVLSLVRGKAELATKKFPVWLKASTGGMSKQDILRQLDNVSAGRGLTLQVSDWARDIISKPEFVATATATEAEFVIATPKDLGFTDNPTTEALFDEANLAKHGVELCKSYDCPSLRKAYTDQPNGEWLPIAMKPILDSDGDWGVLDLKRSGSELWLDAGCSARPKDRWSVDDRFVFRSRKSQS